MDGVGMEMEMEMVMVMVMAVGYRSHHLCARERAL